MSTIYGLENVLIRVKYYFGRKRIVVSLHFHK